MALDFWSDYYFRHPNDDTQEFDSTDFDADVQAMFDDDSLWEEA
jgi:hypothetical protein